MEELIVTVEKKCYQHCSPLKEILLQEESPRSCNRGKLNRTPPSLPKTPICTFLFSWDSGCSLPSDGVWAADYNGSIIHSPFDTTDVSFSIYEEHHRYYIVYIKFVHSLYSIRCHAYQDFTAVKLSLQGRLDRVVAVWCRTGWCFSQIHHYWCSCRSVVRLERRGNESVLQLTHGSW